jgi:glycosyltransferase involved in cell wall biosynthesis
MKISILISNYNKEKYIKECILSAINQDYKDIEIIIIDNNSSDNSLKVINKFSDKVIIKKKNRISEFGAFNQIDLIIESFKISTGDVICLLDGDDFFLPNKVSKISEYFLKNKEILILFDTPHINDQNKILPLKLKQKLLNNNWPATVPTSGISFKRDFFELCLACNLFSKYQLLEADFRINFFSNKIYKKYLHVDEYLTFYRQVDNGIMSRSKKYTNNWWKKRLEAHYFIQDIYKQNRIHYRKNYDFYLTKAIVYILSRSFR